MQSSSDPEISPLFVSRFCQALRDVQQSCKPILEDLLKKNLKTMGLVSAEAFAAQTRVLAQSQEKLDQLEQKLQALCASKD